MLNSALDAVSILGGFDVGDLPWRQSIGMRNIVVLAYWGIDLNQIVKTVRQDLPVMIASLQKALRDWPDSAGDDPPNLYSST